MLDNVDSSGVHVHLWMYLAGIAVIHKRLTGEDLVVTSLRRPPTRGRLSKHSPPAGELVTAGDFRRWALDRHDNAERFCRQLQEEYGAQLGVVLEPEWLSREQLEERGGIASVGPHVHVQLKTLAWPRLL